MNDPLRLVQLLADGELKSAHLPWLQNGFREYLRGEPLERALKLTKSDCVRVRNRALLRADKILTDPLAGLTPWQRAGRLHAAQMHFLRRVLPGLTPTLRERLSPLHSALADAASSGARPLTSQRRLHKLLDNN